MAPSDDDKDYEDQKQEKCPLSIPVELDQHQEDIPESQVVWATHKMREPKPGIPWEWVLRPLLTPTLLTSPWGWKHREGPTGRQAAGYR